MTEERAAFASLLRERLIPEFCSDAARRMRPSGFREESMRVSEVDARYFLMAWRAALIEHQGRGIYRAARSAVGEQFFWEGRRASRDRSFTLWLEPVITIGGLARLHFDFGWPRHLVGCQSDDWAFDLVATFPDQSRTVIAGEVKKSKRELDELVPLMRGFGHDPAAPEPPQGKQRNAYKKVVALRTIRAPVFWCLGPDGDSRVFRVRYDPEGEIELLPTKQDALRFGDLAAG